MAFTTHKCHTYDSQTIDFLIVFTRKTKSDIG